MFRGKSGEVRACEFLCEFSVDLQNAAKRIANIQVFCVNTLSFFTPSNSMGVNLGSITSSTNNTISQPVNLLNQVFTTRHNSSCAVLFLDSAYVFLMFLNNLITKKKFKKFNIHFYYYKK